MAVGFKRVRNVGSLNGRTRSLHANEARLNTVVKLGILGVLAGGAYVAYQYIAKSISAFSFTLLGYGTPRLLPNNILMIPVNCRFVNPTPVTVAVDNVLAIAYIVRNGAWVKAGQINQPINIPPGTSDTLLNLQVDLKSLLSGDLASNIALLVSAAANQKISVRTDVTVTYLNATLPTQTFVQDISLK